MIRKFFGKPDLMGRIERRAGFIGRNLLSILAYSPIQGLFVRQKSMAISVGWDNVQIAHGDRFWNRIRVQGYQAYPLQEDRYPAPEKIAAMAAGYAGQSQLSHPPVMLCLPKAWSVIRTTELPAATRENLSDVIAFELDRITPFGSEEAYYDFRVLKDEGDMLKVAVAAIKKEKALPYIKALSDKELSVTHITISLSAIGTYLNYALGDPHAVYLGVHPKYYEGGLMRDGIMTAGCNGSFSGRPDGSLVANIGAELNPWMQRDGASEESPRLMVHLSGDLSDAGMEEMLPWPADILKDEDLKVPGFSGEEKSGCMPYTAIGGVLTSLWPKSRAFDLLRRGRAEKRRLPLALTLILTMVLLTIGSTALVLPVYTEKQRIAGMEREIATRKESVKQVELLRREYDGLNHEVRTIEAFKKGKPVAVDILRELTAILPKSVWLTRLHVSDAVIDIEGYAEKATDILSLIEASPLLAKAEFTSQTVRDSRRNLDRFVIRMEAEGVKREEPKVANGKKQ